MQDHTEGSSMNSQALETMQERLREAEKAVRREQESYRQMQVNIPPSPPPPNHPAFYGAEHAGPSSCRPSTPAAWGSWRPRGRLWRRR